MRIMLVSIAFTLGFSGLLPVRGQTPQAVDLSTMHSRFLVVQQAWGELGVNAAAHQHGSPGEPLTIADESFTSGLGHHADGEIIIDLAGGYQHFEAKVGLQNMPACRGSVVFRVYVDEELRFDSGVMRMGEKAKAISLPVEGAELLRLSATDGGDGIGCDMANWVEARLTVNPSPPPRVMRKLMDMAPFAEVVGSDPHRTKGAHASRVEEFRAEDLYMEWPLPAASQGGYEVPRAADGTGCIGLRWMERRRLRSLGCELASDKVNWLTAPPTVQCWVGVTRWQGDWKTIEGSWTQREGLWIFSANESNGPLANPGTVKIRMILPDMKDAVRVRRFVAPVVGYQQDATLTFHHLAAPGQPATSDGVTIQTYNAAWVTPEGLSFEPVSSTTAEPLTVQVRYRPAQAWFTDRAVLRVQTGKHAFGIAVDDVVQHGCVSIPWAGLAVVHGDAKTGLDRCPSAKEAGQTVLQQVRSAPDQTLAKAFEKVHNAWQDPQPVLLSLACDNHKFIALRDGQIDFSTQPETVIKYVGEALPLAGRLVPTFGSMSEKGFKRSLELDWMPIPRIERVENGLHCTQRIFVAPLSPCAVTTQPADNGPSVCVTEFVLRNDAEESAKPAFKLAVYVDAQKQLLADLRPVEGGAVATSGGRLLAFIQWDKPLSASMQGGAVSWDGSLSRGESARIVAYLPAAEMAADQVPAWPSFNDLLASTIAYWHAKMADAAQVNCPDKFLNNLIRASQVHCLLAGRNESNAQRVAAWAASMSYGPLESEGHAVIRGMDYLGQHEFARRSLEYFIHRYNSEGMLTTGYTLMGTGWHLWTLGEHYALTRDQAWLRKVAPDVARVCHWVVRQRHKTLSAAPKGTTPVEAGLMPPGVMADWGNFAYYFCLNAYYSAGLASAGRALADINHGDAAMFIQEAEELRQSTLAAYKHTQKLMPVYLLRSGIAVPGYPSQLYTPAPTAWFFPGEDGNRSWCYDIELGAHQVISAGILPADADDATSLVEHHEDVQFLASGFGDYPADKNAKDPFNYGGFAKLQPYYCRIAEIHAMRNDVKPFIRAYFNAIPSLLSREVLSFQEHFSSMGAWNKTHETGYFLYQTHQMLAMDRGNELWLAPFVPAAWMTNGQHLEAKRIPTPFGPVSYRLESLVAAGFITARIDPPARSRPDKLILRVRHPEGKPIRRVVIDERISPNVDINQESITLQWGHGPIQVRVEY